MESGEPERTGWGKEPWHQTEKQRRKTATGTNVTLFTTGDVETAVDLGGN